MPTITIDGKPCEFDGKKMIVQVAIDHGINVPHYCYHPGLSVVASCRICLAEVAQPNPRNDGKVELIPKLVPTCQTPAVDGAEVFLSSPKSIANQKAVMEFLLINHPLDCPVCDQAGECYLQDYSFKFGRSESRFEELKIKQPKKDIGPNVLLYSDRCIMCSRCVRFTNEVSGTREIGIFGRGSAEQIDVFPGKPLDNELSGNVVDLCPVGALLDKDFLMSMRVWNLTKHAGIDGITASGDNLSVETNEGRVYRVKPRTNLDINQWWISDEIRYGWKFVHSDDRFTTPRTQQTDDDGQTALADAAWPDALDAAALGLRDAVARHGNGSLAVMVSPMLSCEDAYQLGTLARSIDPNAILAVGPVPVDGTDKPFPGNYTIRAEKAPNARGVRRALETLCDHVHDYEGLLDKLNRKTTHAVILTGNYPSAWATPDLINATAHAYTVLIDTLPNNLTARADVLLPAATWLEKSGCFENCTNTLQSFDAAIPVLEGARADGQIALDLAAAHAGTPRSAFDAAATRAALGDGFTAQVQHPATHDAADSVSAMQYVEL